MQKPSRSRSYQNNYKDMRAAILLTTVNAKYEFQLENMMTLAK